MLPRVLFEREPGWQFSLMLGLELIFLFLAVPALSAGDANRSLVSMLQLMLAGTAIGLVAKSSWVRLVIAASFGATVLAHFAPGTLSRAATLAMSFGYNFLVTAIMSRAVFGPGAVNHHRIAGAVFIYLNVALLFALGFEALWMLIPGALNGFPVNEPVRLSDMIHFSFTTLTTIGDGPISPNSPFAKSLSDLEAIVGHLFPAILLSRLVGLHLSSAK